MCADIIAFEKHSVNNSAILVEEIVVCGVNNVYGSPGSQLSGKSAVCVHLFRCIVGIFPSEPSG